MEAETGLFSLSTREMQNPLSRSIHQRISLRKSFHLKVQESFQNQVLDKQFNLHANSPFPQT